jgi:hypothetical protein
MTVGERAEHRYPGVSYDHALPQDWVDFMRDEIGFDVRGRVVWGYPENMGVMGMPLPLDEGANAAINTYFIEIGRSM